MQAKGNLIQMAFPMRYQSRLRPHWRKMSWRSRTLLKNTKPLCLKVAKVGKKYKSSPKGARIKLLSDDLLVPPIFYFQNKEVVKLQRITEIAIKLTESLIHLGLYLFPNIIRTSCTRKE